MCTLLQVILTFRIKSIHYIFYSLKFVVVNIGAAVKMKENFAHLIIPFQIYRKFCFGEDAFTFFKKFKPPRVLFICI